MNVCLDGLRTGSVCFGDVMSRIHGGEIGLTGVGLTLTGIVAVLVFAFVFLKAA